MDIKTRTQKSNELQLGHESYQSKFHHTYSFRPVFSDLSQPVALPVTIIKTNL